MSSTAAPTATIPAPAERQALRHYLGLRWWREALYIGAFYLVYTLVRNKFGSAGISGLSNRTAYEHAETMIDIEQAMSLFIEPGLQRWYLDLPGHGFIRAWNVYYGTAHFVVTIGAFVLLYRRDPRRYPAWRNTLAVMTGAALIGFASYTLMPPRLLDDTSVYGACYQQPPDCKGYEFVDTLKEYGGLWSFDSGAMAKVSNQYAAMPSLHTGWSMWCAFVLYPMARRRWTKALVVLYPAVTVFGIMVTGNHYWIDAVGGLVVFAVGFVIGSKLAALSAARREKRRTGEEDHSGTTDGTGPSGPLSGKPGPSGPLSGKPGPSGPLSGRPGPRSAAVEPADRRSVVGGPSQ